ncbi:hypothetical protein FACS1894132_13950 [Clostridia bacterium]|nr:hypothetical protein FACS1894132_13950 [Clostridia bacterium]
MNTNTVLLNHYREPEMVRYIAITNDSVDSWEDVCKEKTGKSLFDLFENLTDELAIKVSGLIDLIYSKIFEAFCQGLTLPEISAIYHLSIPVVERIIELSKKNKRNKDGEFILKKLDEKGIVPLSYFPKEDYDEEDDVYEIQFIEMCREKGYDGEHLLKG